MNNRNKLVFIGMIMLLAFGGFSCSGVPQVKDIQVSWEVVSNDYSEDARVKLRFTLENQGSITLNAENWMLYFSQSPRRVLATDSSSLAVVEHLSGDWYRLRPLPGFKLGKGQKIDIYYECEYWLINQTDAPRGVYFVFQDQHGKTVLADVPHFELHPFVRLEQSQRHQADQIPLPDALWRFAQNQNLVLLEPGQLHPVVPEPVQFSRQQGQFILSAQTPLFYSPELAAEAQWLQDFLQKHFHFQLKTDANALAEVAGIHLRIAESLKQGEHYRLDIHPDRGIEIQGADSPGVFYALQSLLGLLPLDAWQGQPDRLAWPAVSMQDGPRFEYRGVHVDVARNFIPKAQLLKLIDILAFYKINTLHLHLTDDEGWRLEIAALPELTQVGAQRAHHDKDAAALHPAYGSGSGLLLANTYGNGYYNASDFIEILQYARQRHVRVIPEINLPGHARAAIKAMEARYQRLLPDTLAAEAFRLIDPEDQSVYFSAQHYNDNVVCIAGEGVYRFLETVLDAVQDYYQQAGALLDIVHIGGDEVPAGAWSASPRAQKLMAQTPAIDIPANLHAHFTQKAWEIFQKRGLRMGGWEEIAMWKQKDGSHVVNLDFAHSGIIPYVWNNLWGAQDLAYRMANRGYPVVLSHVTHFYFDLAYNKDPLEPGLYWAGFVDTRNAWFYNPFNIFQTTRFTEMGRLIDVETEYQHMERLLPQARKNILGLQAQLWSETIRGGEMLEYYLLPKLMGFAQSAWCKERPWEHYPGESLDEAQIEQHWNVFANTLGQKELPRLAYLFGGYNYRIPLVGARIEDEKLYLNSEYPGLHIRYTRDGSLPLADSPLYENPLRVRAGEVYRFRAFDSALGYGRVTDFKIP